MEKIKETKPWSDSASALIKSLKKTTYKQWSEESILNYIISSRKEIFT